MDPTVRAETQFYEGTATFTVPVKLTKKASPGKQKAEIDATYQACNNRICLPPHTDKVFAPVEIAGRHSRR
jgi:DsbC/DsbD-like thiol-disulfide interchange protein